MSNEPLNGRRNIRPGDLPALERMHYLMNDVLSLGFEYLLVPSRGRGDARGLGRDFIHIITPEWLGNCTMMDYPGGCTLCSRPLVKRSKTGYEVVEEDDRRIFRDVPTPDITDQNLCVCDQCMFALTEHIWPIFRDDEVFQDVTILPPLLEPEIA